MKQIFNTAIFGFLLLYSCDHSTKIDVSNVTPGIQVSHFDKDFFSMDSLNLSEDLSLLRQSYPEFFRISQDDETLFDRYFDTQIRELVSYSDSVFPDIENLNEELFRAFQFFYYYFPNHENIKIYTWISNFESLDPILVSGNTILIALDMYLGSSSDFYKTAPDYIRYGLDRKFILSDLYYYYFSSHIPLSDDNSLLASMLHYGKIHYLTSKMLPISSQDVIMKYSKQKMDWCVQNESDIWAYFIDNRLLFSNNQQNKQRFIDDAPFSKFHTTFDGDTPGRVGQWLGWKIISSYMKNNSEINLLDLIREDDFQKILRESHYKPK
tara:strand:- start:496 stop:1467 length:972 start_codon:yes stop_codon:yes gene_type:complete